MIENTVYMGVNAPKIHQRIIGQLMMRLGMLYYIEKKIPYEPLPEVPEGFVYNYDTGQWRKYRLGAGEDVEKPSFSEEIKLDLGALL